MRIKKLLLIFLVVIALLATLAPVSSLSAASARADFKRIARGGNGDAMNNYAWSTCVFQGMLYVGTGRNIPYQAEAGFKMELGLPDSIKVEAITHPREPIGSYEWAEDMCAEIWRYNQNKWEQVYKAKVVDISDQFGYEEGSGEVYTASEFGFREMIVYTDKDGVTALYATNGAQTPRYSQSGSLMLRSVDGVTWEPITLGVSGTWDSRTLEVHNGKLYIGLSTIIGFGDKAEIWATDNPADEESWKMVADLTLDGNQAVATLTSFNGLLYAGTVNEQGYQIWRSTVAAPVSDEHWIKLVENGAGDMTNLFAGTTKVFKGQLYVGSMSIPLPTGDTIRLPKGFELIRIDTDDSWELLIGDPIAQNPPSGIPEIRTPASGWPGGFANPLNFYCWSLEEVEGELYLGTFDASILLLEMVRQGVGIENLTPQELQVIINAIQNLIGNLGSLGMDDSVAPMTQVLKSYQAKPFNWERVLKTAVKWSCGGDIWKSVDGVNWEPANLNGLENPHNYGIREMLNAGKTLYVGTANPFDGFEVFNASMKKLTRDNQYNQGNKKCLVRANR